MDFTKSITENKDFKRLYYRGERFNTPLLVLYVLDNLKLGKNAGNQNSPRDRATLISTNYLGITVSTKIGNAVQRNKVRRWIKESYISFEDEIKSGKSMVILAREGAAESDFATIKKYVGGMMKKANLFKSED